jgi:hypothetical protein
MYLYQVEAEGLQAVVQEHLIMIGLVAAALAVEAAVAQLWFLEQCQVVGKLLMPQLVEED